MTEELSQEVKDFLRLALDSHDSCVHNDLNLCNMLIVMEVQLRTGREFEEDWEFTACGKFLADCVLESLILKGYIEVEGMDEDGDFTLGFTEAGLEVKNQMEEQQRKEGNNGEG